MSPISAERTDALSGAALAQDGERLAAVDAPAHVAHGLHGAGARVEFDTEVARPREMAGLLRHDSTSAASSRQRWTGSVSDPQPVGEQVQRHGREGDCKAGPEGQPPGGAEIVRPSATITPQVISGA